MQIAIREAEPSDAPTCADVHVDGWTIAYRDTPLREHLARGVGGTVVVMEINGWGAYVRGTVLREVRSHASTSD